MTDKTKLQGDSTKENSSRDTASEPGITRRSRRRLIQLLTAGGVVTSARLLPTEWAKPVVESVALPAHAQTTGEAPGETIELGNDEPFGFSDNSPNGERPESLLASGIETAGEAVQHMINAAMAGDDPEDFTGCELNGCVHIRYKSDKNHGTLFLGIEDFSADAESVEDIDRPFVDGEVGDFTGTCLEPGGASFRVDLINKNSALFTLIIDGGKTTIPVNLVPNFLCVPNIQ